MTLFRILSHPYTFLLCYIFLVISGQHVGGFYSLYILTGLFAGANHSLLAAGGTLLIIVAHKVVHDRRIKTSIFFLGFCLLVLSLFIFFLSDTRHYNWSTFEEVLPVTSFFFTGFIAICFLTGIFWQPAEPGSASLRREA